MSEILAMTPKERKKRVRTDQIKANVGLTTALGGLGAAGLMLTPGIARNRAVKQALKNTKRPERARAFLESKRPTLESAATKVLLYGAAPGAAVGVAHSSTARQDAKNLKSLIRRDGTLKPGAKDKLTKAAAPTAVGAGKALRRVPSIKKGNNLRRGGFSR